MEIFHALNVNEGGEIIAILNQTAGDTGDGRLDGNTGIHERQRGAADGSLGGGTVGGKNF